MEKEPLTTAAAKARFVAPPKFAAVHYALCQISSLVDSLLEVVTYRVQHRQRSDHSVYKIYTSKTARSVCDGKKRHQCSSEDTNWFVRYGWEIILQ
jgi:hypothetical protein